MKGGSRPGAGRPKLNKSTNPTPKCVMAEVQTSNMQPLEYMLKVMNDLTVDETRRDRMAIAAAPYCHARKTDEAPMGKKDQRAEAAATAGGTGTEWSDDLEVNQVN